MRHIMMLAALICASFIFFEKADNLDMGLEIMLKANKYRKEEITWQLESDKISPKVGDMAPDFVLHDTTGINQIRLSDFRDKKPVVLIFGSHT